MGDMGSPEGDITAQEKAMPDWIRASVPRKATWSRGRLSAAIEDDGHKITVSLTAGAEPFLAMVERRHSPSAYSGEVVHRIRR